MGRICFRGYARESSKSHPHRAHGLHLLFYVALRFSVKCSLQAKQALEEAWLRGFTEKNAILTGIRSWFLKPKDGPSWVLLPLYQELSCGPVMRRTEFGSSTSKSEAQTTAERVRDIRLRIPSPLISKLMAMVFGHLAGDQLLLNHSNACSLVNFSFCFFDCTALTPRSYRYSGGVIPNFDKG
jgi:hypothetical protein